MCFPKLFSLISKAMFISLKSAKEKEKKMFSSEDPKKS